MGGLGDCNCRREDQGDCRNRKEDLGLYIELPVLYGL